MALTCSGCGNSDVAHTSTAKVFCVSDYQDGSSDEVCLVSASRWQIRLCAECLQNHAHADVTRRQFQAIGKLLLSPVGMPIAMLLLILYIPRCPSFPMFFAGLNGVVFYIPRRIAELKVLRELRRRVRQGETNVAIMPAVERVANKIVQSLQEGTESDEYMLPPGDRTPPPFAERFKFNGFRYKAKAEPFGCLGESASHFLEQGNQCPNDLSVKDVEAILSDGLTKPACGSGRISEENRLCELLCSCLESFLDTYDGTNTDRDYLREFEHGADVIMLTIGLLRIQEAVPTLIKAFDTAAMRSQEFDLRWLLHRQLQYITKRRRRISLSSEAHEYMAFWEKEMHAGDTA